MEGMVEIFDMLLATTSRFRVLKLKPEEFVCLKAIVLLNSGEARWLPSEGLRCCRALLFVCGSEFQSDQFGKWRALERAGLVNRSDSRSLDNMRQHTRLWLSRCFRYSLLLFLCTFPAYLKPLCLHITVSFVFFFES